MRNYKPNLQNLKGRTNITKQNHGNKTKTFLNSHSVQSDSVSSILLFPFDSLFCINSLWDRLHGCNDGNEREKMECERLGCVEKLLDDVSCFFKGMDKMQDKVLQINSETMNKVRLIDETNLKMGVWMRRKDTPVVRFGIVNDTAL